MPQLIPNIGKIKTEVVKVVFQTNDDEDFYILDEEQWIEYEDAENRDIKSYKDLEKYYKERLGNGAKYEARNLRNFREKRTISKDNVKKIYVTNHSNK